MGRTWELMAGGVGEELAQMSGLGDLDVTQPNCTYGEGRWEQVGDIFGQAAWGCFQLVSRFPPPSHQPLVCHTTVA